MALSVLAERHQGFFNLLRAGQLVAKGIFRNTGRESPVAQKEWGRPDRYLDVRKSDLLTKKAEAFSALWESVTLRPPNQDKGLKPRWPLSLSETQARTY